MFGTILKIAGVATAVGFAAGIWTHHKAEKAKDAVKEKFSKMETHVVEVQVPKGTNLDQCQMQVLVPKTETEA
jgi:HPt (histidine-containing phosphotransfer) domain-containing protein